MFLPLIIHDYFVWHYGRAWWELWGVWRNYLWFVIHVFSIPQLMRSWFAPFKRITEQRRSSFSREDIAAYIIINLVSRVIGLVIRTIIISLGLVVLTLTVGVGVVVYLTWALLPFLIVGLVGASLSLFFIRIL